MHVPPASLPYLTVETLGIGDGRGTVRAPGKVTFRDGAVTSVGPPVAGRVADVRVQIGDRVAAGDVLVVLTSPAGARVRAELARAQAAMAAAADHVRRETEMVSRGIGLEVERVEAKTKYEGDLAHVAVGAEAAITLASGPTPVAGRVMAVGAAIEPGMRRAPVYVAVDANATSDLRPNTYARVAIMGDGEHVVNVPVGAVLIEDGRRSVVWVEQGAGGFARRDVTVGATTDGDRVEVTAGLAPGERVVVRGALLLDSTAEQLL